MSASYELCEGKFLAFSFRYVVCIQRHLHFHEQFFVYQASCFSPANALGKKEIAEKNGYYIIAYYDKESGTTAEEEIETKAVYQKIVDTFTVK